ncbi:MAG: NPCBM/NEW2 domain-containing protein [Pirellulales bacterium]
MSLVSTLISIGLLTSAIPVEVQTLDGTTVVGELQKIEDSTLTLKQEGSKLLELDTNDLLTISFNAKNSPTVNPPKFNVYMADGSHTLAEQLSFESGKVNLTTIEGVELSFGSSSLRSILLKQQSESFSAQWTELHQEKILGDAIVLRREDALTYQEVIIEKITDEGVAIALEDLKTMVNLEKLEGLLFYQREERKFAKPLCKVITNDGAAWLATKLTLSDQGVFSLVSSSGIQLQLPAQSIQSLDFTDGNIVFLSDLPRDNESWSPFIPSVINKSRLALLYSPRFNEDFQGQPITLQMDGKIVPFSKGIAMHASTELIYQLPEDVKTFKAIAGIAPAVASAGNLHLKIIGDRKVLAEHDINGQSPPLIINADVTGVRRLKIIVEPGESGDFSDQLHFCQARLLK